jgi:peptidyl-dipeptidase Dcp
MNNPLLHNWDTPFGTPPFNEINTSHYKPAVEETISYAEKEIEKIIQNTDQPTFENTIASLDRIGEQLGKVTSILFNLNSADTSKDLQNVAQEVSPLLTRFSNDITLNEKLFSRIKVIYDNRNTLRLTTE